MKDAFVAILGKPFGIVLFQLLEATQYTIYLSLIAFIGGGLIGACVTASRVSPVKILRKIFTAYTWLPVPVCTLADAAVSARAGYSASFRNPD